MTQKSLKQFQTKATKKKIVAQAMKVAHQVALQVAPVVLAQVQAVLVQAALAVV